MAKTNKARPSSATVDEYIAAADPRFRPLLRGVRKTIKSAAPDAVESISYGIPTFKVDGQRLTYFSAATAHCAVHMVRKELLDEAARVGFRVGRGSIQFTPEHPLPEPLLRRIVKARVAEIRPKQKRPAR